MGNVGWFIYFINNEKISVKRIQRRFVAKPQPCQNSELQNPEDNAEDDDDDDDEGEEDDEREDAQLL